MLIPVLLFLAGFALLIKGGDWFVDGATAIAKRFGLPEVLIGATVVSIGTTLPEVMVSSQAAFAGSSGISYGNAIGSVICNTALISALTVAIRPSRTERRTIALPVASFFIAAAVYALLAYTRGSFSRGNGLFFLAFFIVYMILSVRAMKADSVGGAAPAGVSANAERGHSGAPEISADGTAETAGSIGTELLRLIIGAAAIAVGAKLLVDNGTLIAEALGVPESVIGLTMVALGTSLPELVTAITALAKGHSALSLGNIIGANLFNIVLVSGMAITIHPFAIPAEKTIAGMNASLVVDIPVMFLVMLILCVPAQLQNALKRWQGIVLLCIYAAFTAFQFIL